VAILESRYDTYGNVIETRDANGNATNLTFDTTYNQFPVNICNALNQCATAYWDFVMELPTTVVDVNGYWQDRKAYDPLGRLTKLTNRDCSFTTYDYNNWEDKTQRHIDQRSFSAQTNSFSGQHVLMAESKTFIDGLDRNYRLAKNLVDSSGVVLAQALTQSTSFSDTTKNPYTSTVWNFDNDPTAAKETVFYDAAMRQTEVLHADGTFGFVSYSADGNYRWTTATDEVGHSKKIDSINDLHDDP
jgi:YD repeat-containing protein